MTGLIWIVWATCLVGFIYHPHWLGLILGALIGTTVVLAATIWDDWQNAKWAFPAKRRLW